LVPPKGIHRNNADNEQKEILALDRAFLSFSFGSAEDSLHSSVVVVVVIVVRVASRVQSVAEVADIQIDNNTNASFWLDLLAARL
jgi:hypothetical protein